MDFSQLKFDANGLIPAIAQDARTNQVLMLAYMNQQSIEQTLETGYATYFSRSRQALWKKGETSGHTQKLVAMRYDCDHDAMLLTVEQVGPACHTGAKSCFFNDVYVDEDAPATANVLQEDYVTIADRAANPVEGSYTNYLLDNGLCNDAERAYLEALKKLHASTAGEGIGVACADGPFGPLTVIGGRIYMEDGKMVQTMDSRYPTCTTGDKMAEQIRAAIGSGASLENVESAKPFYIEADTPAIKACIDTYNEVTGENATPFTMGGGTYARHFPYAVSFGPEHVDLPLPEFGGPMHGANEAAPIDKLLEAVKIYILALLRLEEIDF